MKRLVLVLVLAQALADSSAVAQQKDIELAPIPSDPQLLAPWRWRTESRPPTGEAKPDVVGAFRFLCMAGPVGQFDPIVNPGESNVGHRHQFFGNVDINPHSTYESLRRTQSIPTCQGGPLNQSGYWIPTLETPDGKIIRPDFVSIYYKAVPGQARRIPRGLKYVNGFNTTNMKAQDPPGTNPGPAYYWNCDGSGAASSAGHHPNIKAVYDAGCRATPYDPDIDQNRTRIGAVIQSPECWDGKHLDTPDHRSHMAFKFWDNGVSGKPWPGSCPRSHPIELPAFTLGAWYTVDPGFENWFLSSDKMPGMSRTLKGGESFHADWFGAWDDEALRTWHDHCINRLLSCSGFVLGDGSGGHDGLPVRPWSWIAKPHSIPVSSMASTHH